MESGRLYIVQILGILLLLCGYFLSDQPDSLSVMHFDPNPACPTVITKGIKSTTNEGAIQTVASSHNNTSRRTSVPKYISFELFMPHTCGYQFPVLNKAVYTIALPENYEYLYFEEINPPPPKSC
jgi:hypothetical protein